MSMICDSSCDDSVGSIPDERRQELHHDAEGMEVTSAQDMTIDNEGGADNIASIERGYHVEHTNGVFDDEQLTKEIQHVRRRIKNVREQAIQQSTVAIGNAVTYQSNVLNAVTGCFNEYRSIMLHHIVNKQQQELQEEEEALAITLSAFPTRIQSLIKETSLQVFELIQHSLQCGPLAGSNPGYFKRCGGDVASIVQQYLDTMFASSSDATPSSSIPVTDTQDESTPDQQDEEEEAEEDDDDDANETSDEIIGGGEEEEEGPSQVKKDDATQSLRFDRSYLFFTSKQKQAIEKWKKNAHKAACNNRPPSNSVLKKQAKATSQKYKKDTLQSKKKNRRIKKQQQKHK